MDNNFTFPQYRKYTNEKSFFELKDAQSMVEYQIMGSRYAVYGLVAKILPERNLLQDMLDCLDGRWVEISGEEFEAFKTKLESDFTKIG